MYKTVIFMTCLSLVGCGDRIQNDSSDLGKYPWVATFTPKGKDFSRGEHNLDTGRYTFSFRSDLSSTEFFSSVDEQACLKGWVAIKANGCSKSFERASTVFPAANGNDIVSLEYKDGGKILLEYRPNVTAD